MYRNWWSKQIKPEVLLAWTGNVHLCTNLFFTFLVGSAWKSSVVREKSLKMTAIFLHEFWFCIVCASLRLAEFKSTEMCIIIKLLILFWSWFLFCIHINIFHGSGTSPLGHLYSRDTSVQREKKIWSKRSKKFLYLLPLLKKHLYSGVKEHSFWDLIKCSLVTIVTAF